jgi:hypothetical protein
MEVTPLEIITRVSWLLEKALFPINFIVSENAILVIPLEAKALELIPTTSTLLNVLGSMISFDMPSYPLMT